jgi:hypothetical protein
LLCLRLRPDGSYVERSPDLFGVTIEPSDIF